MPRFLLDENVHKPDTIISRCKDLGIEVVRVHQISLDRTDDSLIFDHAMEQDYVFVTGNIRDFRPLQQKWLADNNPFPGVIYLSTIHYRNIEDIIRTIERVENTYNDSELREWWV